MTIKKINILTAIFIVLLVASNRSYGQVSDSKLLSLIKNELNVAQDEDIPENKYDSLIHLDAGSLNISDLTGLDKFKNLGVIDLSNNTIADIAVLASLPNLHFVNLAYNNISDISALANTGSEKIQVIIRRNCVTDFTTVDHNLLNSVVFIDSDEQKSDCNSPEATNILYSFQLLGGEDELEFLYRGVTTNNTPATLLYGDGVSENAVIDGLTQIITHTYNSKDPNLEATLSLKDQQLIIDLSFALEEINLISPLNNEAIVFGADTPLSLQWSAVSNADSYEIGIYKGEELMFNNLMTENSLMTNLSLDVGASCSWKIRSRKSIHTGRWSESRIFNLIAPNQSPTAITLSNTISWRTNRLALSSVNSPLLTLTQMMRTLTRFREQMPLAFISMVTSCKVL